MASLLFSHLTLPKTLIFSNPKTPIISISPPSLKFHSKFATLLSPSFLFAQSDKGCKSNLESSRFVRKVAVSSEFDQDEEELSGDEGEQQQSFSPDLKLFVGNLPFDVDSAALAGLFERAGNVEMVEVIYDKMTGRSRGFAFVTMSSVKEVEAAAQQFNGYELEGRALRVNFGPPPPKDNFDSRPPRSEYGSRGGSSSYGSRGGSSSYESRGGSRGELGYGSRGESGYGSRSESGYGSRGESGYGSRGESSYGSRGESGYGSRGGGSSYGSRGGGSSSDSSNRVYVGNLSWGVDDMALETLFGEKGKVMEAKVVYDRESGRSRGFGFVTYSSADEVNKAVDSLDGALTKEKKDLDGRSIRVTVAESKPRRQF